MARKPHDYEPDDSAAADGLEPEQEGRGRSARKRASHELKRLGEALPLPQIVLPHLFTSAIGPSEVTELAAAMASCVEALPTVDA